MLADDAGELDWLLFHQSDLLTRPQALRFFTEAAIRHRLSSKRWRRVHPGVYLTTTAEPTWEQELWIAVLAAGPDALLAGSTALAHQYRLVLPGQGGVHLLVPAGSHGLRLPAGVLSHRSGVLPDEDVHRLASPPATMPERSVVDAAAWAGSDRQAIMIVAAGFQRRLFTHASLTKVVDRLPRVRRRDVILQAAMDAAGGSHSLGEIDYLRIGRRYGLPEPTRQLKRTDVRGARRYLDIYYEEFRLHVEIDGGQHLDVRAVWDDMRRQNDLWIAGDRVLRFPAWLLRERPNEVFTQIRETLTAAGWRAI